MDDDDFDKTLHEDADHRVGFGLTSGRTPMFWFRKEKDAADFLHIRISESDPEGVWAGRYYIDVPEDMQ